MELYTASAAPVVWWLSRYDLGSSFTPEVLLGIGLTAEGPFLQKIRFKLERKKFCSTLVPEVISAKCLSQY